MKLVLSQYVEYLKLYCHQRALESIFRMNMGRDSLKCPRLSICGGGVKNGQNLVHVVIEYPHTRKYQLRGNILGVL